MRRIQAVWPKRLRYPNGWLLVLRVPIAEAVQLRLGEIVESVRPDGCAWRLRVLQTGALDGNDYHPCDNGLWLWNGEWWLDPKNHPRLPGHTLGMFRRIHHNGEEAELSIFDVEPLRADYRTIIDRIK